MTAHGLARPMELTFLGTRGNTEKRSRRHWRHSALLVRHAGASVMIDCGADWLRSLPSLSPSGIVLSHAHPDHAQGLKQGAPCPVFATAETAASLRAYPIADMRIIGLNKPFRIGALKIEAFPVAHSILAPTVGYRITGGRSAFFYVPDVVAIPQREQALKGVSLYVGDGATISRPIIRRRRTAAIGHTPIRTQLQWCAAEGVDHAIFTHCGSKIVTGDARRLDRLVESLGEDQGVNARIAYDGLRIVL